MTVDANPIIDGNGRLHLYNSDDRGIRLHISGISRLFFSLCAKTIEVKASNITYVVNANSAIQYFKTYGVPDKPSPFTIQLYRQVLTHQAANALKKFSHELTELENRTKALSPKEYPQTIAMTKELLGSMQSYKERLLEPSSDGDIVTAIQATNAELFRAAKNLEILNQQLKAPETVEGAARKLNQAQGLSISHVTKERVERYVQKAHFEAKTPAIKEIQSEFQRHDLKLQPAHALFTREMSDVRKGLSVVSGTIHDYIEKTIPYLCSFFEMRYDTISRLQDDVSKLEGSPHTHRLAFDLLASVIGQIKTAPLPPPQEQMQRWKRQVNLIDELCHSDVKKVGLERTLDGLHQDLQALKSLSGQLQALSAHVPAPLQETFTSLIKELQKSHTKVSAEDFLGDSVKSTLGQIQEFRPRFWEISNSFYALSQALSRPGDASKLPALMDKLLQATLQFEKPHH